MDAWGSQRLSICSGLNSRRLAVLLGFGNLPAHRLGCQGFIWYSFTSERRCFRASQPVQSLPNTRVDLAVCSLRPASLHRYQRTCWKRKRQPVLTWGGPGEGVKTGSSSVLEGRFVAAGCRLQARGPREEPGAGKQASLPGLPPSAEKLCSGGHLSPCVVAQKLWLTSRWSRLEGGGQTCGRSVFAISTANSSDLKKHLDPVMKFLFLERRCFHSWKPGALPKPRNEGCIRLSLSH